jgi:hypothetical protein
MTTKDIENGIFFANDDPQKDELRDLVLNLSSIELEDNHTYNVIRFIEYCKKSRHFSYVADDLDKYLLWLWNNKEDRNVQMVLLAHEDLCNTLRKKLTNPQVVETQEPNLIKQGNNDLRTSNSRLAKIKSSAPSRKR